MPFSANALKTIEQRTASDHLVSVDVIRWRLRITFDGQYYRNTLLASWRGFVARKGIDCHKQLTFEQFGSSVNVVEMAIDCIDNLRKQWDEKQESAHVIASRR